MSLTSLLKRCLAANYIHSSEGGDYAIEVDKNVLYVLFEWSDGKEDWRNNFDFPCEPYKDMNPKWYCHRGFLRVWKAIRDEVELKVAEEIKKNINIEKIICVGYSHGAALSVLATEDLTYIYGNIVNGYGFGGPRVIWGIVPKEVKERLKYFVSIRNIPDLVTHVPPMILGYRNAGTLIKIGEKGKYSPIEAHFAEAYLFELRK